MAKDKDASKATPLSFMNPATVETSQLQLVENAGAAIPI